MKSSRRYLMFLVLTGMIATCLHVKIYAEEMNVGLIKTEELMKLQTEQKAIEENAAKKGIALPSAKFVLVDVRSEAEQNVSMIPGAVTKETFEKNIEKYKECTVIPYCLSGGRCSRYAQQLSTKGIKVLNYKGSIYDWCQKKQPLVTPDGKPTNKVLSKNPGLKFPDEYKVGK